MFNLCSEQHYGSSYFGSRVERFPFDDHDVPPLGLVRLFCARVQQWLAQNEENVVVIHCKVGPTQLWSRVVSSGWSREGGTLSPSTARWGRQSSRDGGGKPQRESTLVMSLCLQWWEGDSSVWHPSFSTKRHSVSNSVVVYNGIIHSVVLQFIPCGGCMVGQRVVYQFPH